MKNYVPCLICGNPVEREAQDASPFVREFQALKAAEVNGGRREVGASAQPAGAAAAPTGIPAGGQFGSGGSPAGPYARDWTGFVPGQVLPPRTMCTVAGCTCLTFAFTNGQGPESMVCAWENCRHTKAQHGIRTFPVLGPAWAPREIPWAYVEPHRRQAMVNHRRTLEDIAERGGLDPIELVAVLEDRPGRWMGQIEAADRLNQLLAVFGAGGMP